jgi:hypothetical protein
VRHGKRSLYVHNSLIVGLHNPLPITNMTCIVVDPHWFESGSELTTIVGQCGFGSMVLMTKNRKIFQLKKIQFFLGEKIASMMDVQGTREAFSPFLVSSRRLPVLLQSTRRRVCPPGGGENPALQNMNF